MALIKIKLKIGGHKQEVFEIDTSYDEEVKLYDDFIDTFLNFQNNLKKFRYSSNTVHLKTGKPEIFFENPNVTWSEFKNQIREILDKNLEYLKKEKNFQASDIKELYKIKYGFFPMDKAQAVSEVLKEYKNRDIFTSFGERRNTRYAVVI